MIYSKELREYAKVRMEQTPNNTQIARDIKREFNHPREIEAIRRVVSGWRSKWKLKAKAQPIKRLFFDIETGYYILKIRAYQLKNYIKYFNHDDIQQEKEVLAISYKWQGEDEVHTLDWRMGEKKMLKTFIKIMGEADEIVAHNGDRFDIAFLRARCLFHRVKMFPKYRTLDTLIKSRRNFLLASHTLDYLGKYYGIGGKMYKLSFEDWKAIVEDKCEKTTEKMRRYCERDVTMLEDIFTVMSPYIDHNNNFAVLTGGEKWECPECAGSNVKMHNTYSTPMGTIRREMKCRDCAKQYRISNKTYTSMLRHISTIDDE